MSPFWVPYAPFYFKDLLSVPCLKKKLFENFGLGASLAPNFNGLYQHHDDSDSGC
jgi:hypothetical protein